MTISVFRFHRKVATVLQNVRRVKNSRPPLNLNAIAKCNCDITILFIQNLILRYVGLSVSLTTRDIFNFNSN